MIYTSYFNNRKKGKGRMIAVCSSIPKWLDSSEFIHVREVAPSYDLRVAYKNGSITRDEFLEAYLKEMTADKLRCLLDVIDESQDNYLLCHEAEEWNCHRAVLGYLLRINNYECKEF